MNTIQDGIQLDTPRNTPESLLALAIERGLSVDAIERLMHMAKEVRAERAKAAFIEAMAAFQSACPVIQKTRAVMNKDNKTERYRYAAMEDIKAVISPHLQAHGLSFAFDTIVGDGLMNVICKVQHQDGHSELSTFGVPLGESTFMSPQQNFAATLTYAKRYVLCNALGLVVGDEDNDGAAPPKPQPAREQASAVGGKHPERKPISEAWLRAIKECKTRERGNELWITYSKQKGIPEEELREFGELLDARIGEIVYLLPCP